MSILNFTEMGRITRKCPFLPQKSQCALRPLERAPQWLPEKLRGAVRGACVEADLLQTACEPVPMNGLPQALWVSVRPVQGNSVIQAFQDAVVDAALGLTQFVWRHAMHQVAGREL